MMINKSWCKIDVWFCYIFSFFSVITLDFQESFRVVLLKYLMFFFSWCKYQIILNYSGRKCFTPLRILNIKVFVNHSVDISLTFFDSSFNCILFKLAISFLLVKLACFSLAVIISDVNLLNSWVVIYLSWWRLVLILLSFSVIFVLQPVFFD